MPYQIPSTVRAVIFDLNGTMVRDGEYQRLAYRQFFLKHHLQVTDEEYQAKAASRLNREVWPAVFGRPVEEAEADRMLQEKEGFYEEAYAGKVEEVPGLSQLLAGLHTRGVKLAVATASYERAAFFVLDALGIRPLFDVIVTGEHVSRGKPDPQIYLEAMRRLGVGPEESVAFEDSPRGIQAAVAAGIPVVGVVGDYGSQQLESLGVSGLVADFLQVAW